MSQGVDVVDLGLASTDLVYYAAGRLDAPGAMFTASHNPAQYNGIKLCLAGARPVGVDSGLADIKAIAEAVLDGAGPAAAAAAGRRRARDLLDDFADHVVSFIDLQPCSAAEGRRRHRQRHGRAGRAEGVRAPARSSSRSCTASSTARSRTIPPTRSSPPTSATSRRGSCRALDVGLAFDGDADRVFLVDETGRGLSGSTTTAILAAGCWPRTRAPRSSTT